ncbi:MAG: LOG family protein [Patescibacteria group bacterium]|jgi:hypothetical protein
MSKPIKFYPVSIMNGPRFLRPLRILLEYLGPLLFLWLSGVKDTIVFFGSARVRQGNGYYEAAKLLSMLLTDWSLSEKGGRYLVATGAGPGIMEAANRGASEVTRGRSIGFGIVLPREQGNNQFITKGLSFVFRYFFMRKFWFAYQAKALVVFPGGFGTLDELFELLCLRQTRRIEKPLPIVLYGRDFWGSLIDFRVLVEAGVIEKEDLKLFTIVDDVGSAFQVITAALKKAAEDGQADWPQR